MTEHTPDEEPKVRIVNKRVAVDEPVAPVVENQETVGGEHPEAPSELEQARAEAAGYLDDLRRLQAEFENYRKRMLKVQTHMAARASASIVEKLLPVLDNFELALIAADRTKDYEAMVRGVEIVYGELLEVLHKEGLERIDAVDKPFDPALHEAVMQVDGEGEHLVVVDEMRSGYKVGGRVVRPAMVKVGKR